MSFLTGTSMELIYTSTATGTAKGTFTTEFTINDTAGMGVQAHLPPDFWLPNNNQIGRGIKIVARGIVSSTATPTYTFTIRGGAAANVASTPILLGSAALTAGSGITNLPWVLEGEVMLSAIGAAGGNSSCRGIGQIISSAFTTGTPINLIYAGGSTPGSIATLDTSITNYINFNVACSASSASNTITLQSLQIYGLN